jgi:hypothetical protein
MVGESPVKRVEKPALTEADPDRPLPRDRRGRGFAASGSRRSARPGRARDVPDCGDDGDAPGRAVRAALALRRLDCAEDPRAAQLRPRRVRHAEVEAFGAERPPCQPRCHRARAAVSRLAVHEGRRPRARASGDRQADRPFEAAQAIQGCAAPRRCSRRSLSRPEAHLRNAGCRTGNADARPPGADGPPRLQDDADLRRLRTKRTRGRVVEEVFRPAAGT